MNLLFVTTGIFPDVVGGMQRHSYFLARSLAQQGAVIRLIHPTPGRDYFGDLPNVTSQIIPWPRFKFPYHYVAEYYIYSRRVARFIRERQDEFDVVYGQGSTLWAYLPERRLPCVFNPHGLEPFQAVGWRDVIGSVPLRWAATYQIRHADAVISLGGRLTDILCREGAQRHKLVTVPNGVDLDYVDANLTATQERVAGAMLFVGRLFGNKGIKVLLDAMSRVTDPKAQLFVIGDGPLLESLRRGDRDSRVHFVGRVSDVELFDWYSRVEFFVFPSLFEGMPTVLLEAMAARLPLVATDIGAVSELVGPENGLLVQPGDSAALADAITRMLELPTERRREMGDRSRQKVEARFTWDQVGAATYELLGHLVEERGKGVR